MASRLSDRNFANHLVPSLYASYQPTYHFAAEFAEMGG